MIDLDSESVLPLADVPAVVPPGRNGRRPHVSVIYRWVQRGLRGIRLEAVQVGGHRVTSREALNRFFAALSDRAGLAQGNPAIRSPARRDREYDRAVANLDAAGW
jgi:hypothetical protein